MKEIRYNLGGYVGETVKFVLEKQLKDKSCWKKFVEVFTTREDVRDDGWRGEYFGKTMRGACMIYALTKDEELYNVLTEAVRALLSSQDKFGRISSYPVENEFCGWDIWSRKYVMVGLEYYLSVCKDEKFYFEILSALKKHADYILAKIGGEKTQISILQTSSWWGAANSCSILEPMVELYVLTKDEKYLKFAEYVLSTGGCSAGNLVEHALKQDKMPYEYEEVKAYETMSFFEGVLAYYEVTGKDEYLKAVQNFVENVYDTDITIIGCAGCTHELFDNSRKMQTEYSDVIMQETCVTVTWMRLLARLNRVAPQAKYVERMETSALNALYGAINTEWQKQLNIKTNTYVDPLAFDSYSPLYNNKRGRGIGGFKTFSSGGYYGCCAAIAAAGIALYPLEAVKITESEVIIDLFADIEEERIFDDGFVKVATKVQCPRRDVIVVKVDTNKSGIALRVRVPSFANGLVLNGTTLNVENGYAVVRDVEITGEMTFEFNFAVRRERLNGKSAFCYGPYVLSLDQAKGEWTDFTKSYKLDELEFEAIPCGKGEQVAFVAKGEREFLFTDYASCGKKWLGDERITVWINEK